MNDTITMFGVTKKFCEECVAYHETQVFCKKCNACLLKHSVLNDTKEVHNQFICSICGNITSI